MARSKALTPQGTKNGEYSCLARVIYSALIISFLTIPTIVFSGSNLNMLNKFEEIRVGLFPSAGNGGTAATLELVKRLIQDGYEGEITVVYSLGVVEYDANRSKITSLLAGFSPLTEGEQVIEIGAKKVKFVDADTFRNRRVNKIAIGMTGALETFRSYEEDFAQLLNVENTIEFNPTGFDRTRGSVNGHKFYLRDRDVGTLLPDEIIDTPSKVFQEMAQARKATKHKAESVSWLAKNYHLYETMTSYGLGISGERKIVAIVEALILSQQHNPQKYSRPLLINMLSNLNEAEVKEIERLVRESPLIDESSFRIIDSSSPEFVRMMNESPEEKKVTLVLTGSVPQGTFNFFMDKSSLPPTVAGTGATNFMRRSGRPFLPTAENLFGPGFDLTSFGESEGLVTEVAIKLSNLGRAFAPYNETKYRMNLARKLSLFFLDLKNKESEASLGFTTESARYRRDDRVKDGISVFLSLIDEDKYREWYNAFLSTFSARTLKEDYKDALDVLDFEREIPPKVWKIIEDRLSIDKYFLYDLLPLLGSHPKIPARLRQKIWEALNLFTDSKRSRLYETYPKLIKFIEVEFRRDHCGRINPILKKIRGHEL